MTNEKPAFAKRDNPIKRAIIEIIVEEFERQSNPASISLTFGELETKVREKLRRPNMPASSIRSHTANLKIPKGRYIDIISELPPVNEIEQLDAVRIGTVQSLSFSVSKFQLEALIQVRDLWGPAKTNVTKSHQR